MSSPMINWEIQAEEWAVRYRDLQDTLEEWEEDEVATNNDNGNGNDTATATATIMAKTLVTRAGRLGTLQCAAAQVTEPSHRALMEAWFHHTRDQLDHDLIQSSVQRHLLEQLADKVSAATLQSPTHVADVNVDMGVDTFFEEYPECIRSDTLCDDSSSCSSSEDEDAAEPPKRPRTEPRSATEQPREQAVELQTQQRHSQPRYPKPASSSAMPPQQQQQRPSSRDGPAATNARHNPYQKAQHQPQRPPQTIRDQYPAANPPSGSSGGNFSYTPASQGDAASSWDNPSLVSNNQYRPPSRGSQCPAVATTSTASWNDPSILQNPFQSARDVEHVLNDDARPRTENRDQPSHQHQFHGNPYTNQYPPQQPSNEEAVQGGPSIPNSLRRKFQPPKRVESSTNDGGRPSGFAPSAKGGGVQTTRPSSASGRNNRRTSGNQNDGSNCSSGNKNDKNADDEEELPEELQHLDKELVKKIQNEIMESGDTITFDDIAGLEDAKQTVQEVVCWPMKRPDLFTGLRRAPNGLLLYGPPGTGKTLIGKAIAHESGATFFSISSSSLTSKWIGEGEKLVKTLFAVAAYREPAVVFIDEIDSLLTQRKASENEASRRIKTEFLVQLDGIGTSGQGRVLVIGATNKPQELDEAARRRFTKRLYIPLPAEPDRRILLHVMLKKNNHRLKEEDIDRLAKDTAGFSGADLKSLCTDAAMGPIRQLGPRALEVDVNDVPPITFKHFKRSLKGTKPSVAPPDLVQYEEWDAVYGSKRANEDEDESSDEDD